MASPIQSADEECMTVDTQTRASLFRVVREALREAVSSRKEPAPPLSQCREVGGVFVTLRRNGKLRGCMGTFVPVGTLQEVVDRSARLAAGDPRFTQAPVTIEEIPSLDIEISVLTPPKETDDPESLIIGLHGIWVRNGEKSGCFLPQVAVEQNWDGVEFLHQCCVKKAGLPADAWKNPDTRVWLFTTESFTQLGGEFKEGG